MCGIFGYIGERKDAGSTIIKDVASHGGSLQDFLHPEVARRLQERIRSFKG
jgi:pantetheine-phosphate adenylyltransferase